MHEVQLLSLYTDSSEGGEAFSSEFLNEICTVGIEVRSTVSGSPPWTNFRGDSGRSQGLSNQKPACDY